VDAFRDELGAAHAKIAQLEDQVRELERAAQRNAPSLSALRGSQPSLVLVVTAAVALFLTMVAAGFFFRRETLDRSTSGSPSFKGIATAAAENTSDVIPPVVNPGAVASSSSKPNWNPCDCTKDHDPFCKCR
jgi:hypothetical protein